LGLIFGSSALLFVEQLPAHVSMSGDRRGIKAAVAAAAPRIGPLMA
jgi:hypothetical protein